jgi:hypothetical protein
MNYQYKMAQIPPHIAVDTKQKSDDVAAQYLQTVANKFAKEGWEFFRVDTITVTVQPTCLQLIFGQRMTTNAYYVITFRREVSRQ